MQLYSYRSGRGDGGQGSGTRAWALPAEVPHGSLHVLYQWHLRPGLSVESVLCCPWHRAERAGPHVTHTARARAPNGQWRGRRGAGDSCVSMFSERKTAAPLLRQAAGTFPFNSGDAVRTTIETLVHFPTATVKKMEFGARNKSRCVHPFSAQSQVCMEPQLQVREAEEPLKPGNQPAAGPELCSCVSVVP